MCYGKEVLMFVYKEINVQRMKLLEVVGRPTELPNVEKGEDIICEYVQMAGGQKCKLFIVCRNLQDMKILFDHYEEGWATEICWYAGKVEKN